MKIDLKKIINIKTKKDLNKFSLNKPIFQKNYLFHYLIMLGNLTALKLRKFPIYIENNDGLNGFHLAAKEDHIDILEYLIKNYPDYIYNRTAKRDLFTFFLEANRFSKLIKQFPNLDWDELIINGNSKLYEILLNNLNFNELNNFTNVYKNKSTNAQNLFGLLHNNLLNQEQKIKILDKYSDEEINYKYSSGEGLIFASLSNNEELLFDYLINRNIDVDYYVFNDDATPLNTAIHYDILNNQYIYSKKILEIILKKNKTFYRTIDKYFNNIGHTIIFIRTNRNNQILSAEDIKSINYSLDFEILNLLDSYSWNQKNLEKNTPLNLLTNLNYDIYKKIFINNKIEISKHTLTIVEKQIKENAIDSNMLKWQKLFKSFPEYKEENNDVKMDEYEYSHYVLFQARFVDVCFYSIYLSDTYKDLLIPNMNSYLLNNLTFKDSQPFADLITAKQPIFPWNISYYSESEYYIHPYLNNIINSARRDGNKQFGIVFLCVISDDALHANILIYDFKKMTVERFEPYGNSTLIDGNIDNVLEEELTWNTGLKYLKTSDFIPWAGFQSISDELNLLNKKAGDFGGFCLAWCLWYIETKLKNPNIDSKILIEKLIHKINNLDIKFSEYIRNYANKINEKRIKYLEDIGIESREISNLYVANHVNTLMVNYLVNKYTGVNM